MATEEQNQLLSQMEALVSSRLEAFESRMVDAQRALSETHLAKLKQNFGTNDTYQFRRKGNEEQYKCNREVLSSLREAEAHLGELTSLDAPPAVSAARRKLVEGMSALLHRQKMIRLADSSDSGWRVVQEYEAHPLAEDSDDEKKIYRAQMHADRKARQEKKVKARRFNPYTTPQSTVATSPSSITWGRIQQGGKKPGLCFKCGKPGHWQQDCRVGMESKAETTGSSQISRPLFDYFHLKYESSCANIVEKEINDNHADKEIGIISPVGRLKGLGIETRVLECVDQAGLPSVKFGDLPRKMAELLTNAKSESTNIKYLSYFNKWKSFIEPKGVYSIKWAHIVQGIDDPTANTFVTTLMESAKRTQSKPVIKKDPINANVLKNICSEYTESTDVLVIRDLCFMLLGFSGFLRFDEISSLRCNDVQFYENYFSLRIRKAKTDQYRLGSSVVISKGQSVSCPYTMLKRYMLLTGQSVSDSKYLFRPCYRSGKICNLIFKDKPLSYTRARECILNRLRPYSGDSNIGLHSFRAGGATAAANAGVSGRCWKRHGRWKSDSSKDGYVADSIEFEYRLEVSKSLNL